ncbi:ABC transporter substrate-binding protein [Kordiimonas sediminis]|uniref:ABC transporter substrate-binding protein n=1 Tax=Kordiimonas sediminis TaxID=1735581 RepID=A0A919AKK5_9PROT|nr:thiamine pyrophosphate-dependent dehydrogenase E1 component subunit alpha [Kordiimonas sediminis]GHF12950.1 ABC transporter substrate-binding protein [Kordiimonas sediminis]
MDIEILGKYLFKAAFIRSFEQRLAQFSQKGLVPGLLHLCLGAEVFEVILCSKLDSSCDQVTGSHRSHGLALAMETDPVSVAAEILGLEAGLSAGIGGTQHLLAPESGFLSSNGIVGGQVPMAAGAALSAKVRGTGGIAVTVFGDGAFNQGAISETMNLAAVLSLPVLFIVENNGLGQSTAAGYATAGSVIQRVRSLGIAAERVDSNDIEAVDTVTDTMTAWVRNNGSPAVIEALVPRLGGHYHGENEAYLGDQKVPDPLHTLETKALNSGLAEDQIQDILSRARQDADSAVEQAAKLYPAGESLMAKWSAKLHWNSGVGLLQAGGTDT